jgi:hypothetical protein
MQPGWVVESRPAPVLFFPLALRVLCLLALVLVPACTTTSSGPRFESSQLAALWNDYSAMQGERALAIAGDLRLNRWVAGVAAGRETMSEAKSIALQECAVRRQRQRMQDPCRIYAEGDEIVWKKK